MIDAIISAVGSFITNKLSSSKKLNKWDERLAQKFLQELPSSSWAIGILREHDFNATFVYDYWKPIGNFYAYWTDPDHEFSNKKLQKKMAQFLSAILELKKLVGQHTSPIKGDLQKIHEHAGKAIAQEMNERASDAYKQYSEFCGLLKTYDFEQED